MIQVSQQAKVRKQSQPLGRESLKPARLLFFVFGLLTFAIGFVGVFLPILPTTPFMLLALWAFGKSSARFESWLLTHKRFGPSLRNWQAHRVIPIHGKVLAVVGVLSSFFYVVFAKDVPWYGLLCMGLLLSGVLCYILRRPSRVLGAVESQSSQDLATT